MGDPRTLLQRLHDHPRARRSDDEDALLVASVMESLDQVLGTARGSSMLDPDYGFPTMSEFAYAMPLKAADDPLQPYIQDLKRHLLLVIERYEPRLHLEADGVSIIVDRRDPLVLGFQIHGRLRRGQGELVDYQCSALMGRRGGWLLEEGDR